MEEQIKKALEEAGYDYAVAIATRAEVEAGAACGQLAIIEDEGIEQNVELFQQEVLLPV